MSLSSPQHGWQPVKELVHHLRRKFNHQALFFYNEYCPEIIAILFRPDVFTPQPFSAMASEYKRPVGDGSDMVVTNVHDILREMENMARDVVVDVKVLDQRLLLLEKQEEKEETRRKKRKLEKEMSASSSSSSGSESDTSDED